MEAKGPLGPEAYTGLLDDVASSFSFLFPIRFLSGLLQAASFFFLFSFFQCFSTFLPFFF
jgi:hypothetical protein